MGMILNTVVALGLIYSGTYSVDLLVDRYASSEARSQRPLGEAPDNERRGTRSREIAHE